MALAHKLAEVGEAGNGSFLQRGHIMPYVWTDLKMKNQQKLFERLLDRYHRKHWIDSDPIQFIHRYESKADQEVVGFIAACFAYGQVVLVHRAIEAVLAPMGPSPARFVRGYNGERLWPGFYHRFHREGHVEVLIRVLREVLEQHGSIEELFRLSSIERSGDREAVNCVSVCERALNGAAQWLLECSRQFDKSGSDLTRGLKFFFAAPSGGSACKRMLMYMRWMVRHDEIDVGAWTSFKPQDLLIPADTHVGRISYYLGLRKGREDQAPNWKMAVEITNSLRGLDPIDPVRYDFALARLGILDLCQKRYERSICGRCPVEAGCRFSNLKTKAGVCE